MNACTRKILPALAVLLVACSSSAPPSQSEVPKEVPVVAAELLATDGSWGNTEGPAVDSAGALYFTSRGADKGIIKWTEAEGAQQYANVATMAGPGGLWIANNVGQTQSTLVSWPLGPDGSAAGPKKIDAEFEPCVADGMAVDSNGNVWVACYSFGKAHLFTPDAGDIVTRVTTEQKALTNLVFGRDESRGTLYLSSSDMDRATGYVYRATVETPGVH